MTAEICVCHAGSTLLLYSTVPATCTSTLIRKHLQVLLYTFFMIIRRCSWFSREGHAGYDFIEQFLLHNWVTCFDSAHKQRRNTVARGDFKSLHWRWWSPIAHVVSFLLFEQKGSNQSRYRPRIPIVRLYAYRHEPSVWGCLTTSLDTERRHNCAKNDHFCLRISINSLQGKHGKWCLNDVFEIRVQILNILIGNVYRSKSSGRPSSFIGAIGEHNLKYTTCVTFSPRSVDIRRRRYIGFRGI